MGTAFVLTGGGSLGVVQVGMLGALHEHGIGPDLLRGAGVDIGMMRRQNVVKWLAPGATRSGGADTALVRSAGSRKPRC